MGLATSPKMVRGAGKGVYGDFGVTDWYEMHCFHVGGNG